MVSEDKLTTEQHQELYTLMGQWSRNTDLQFQKVAEWTDKQLAQVCEQRDAELLKLQLAAKLKPSQESEALQRANAAELALQAKEQELAQLKSEQQRAKDLFWPSANEKEAHIYEIRNGHTKEFVEAHVAELIESEKAQARQQAIADAREEICELAETAAIGNSEPSRSTLLKLVQVIRSLTPPPALTKEK